MLSFLNERLSIRARLGLISACFAAPIALLVLLLIVQCWKDVRFAHRELEGAAYLEQVWPMLAVAAEGSEPLDGRAPAAPQAKTAFASPGATAAFDSAHGDAKLAAGMALIRSVADGSNLILDPELPSFYSVDAATVSLPQLMISTAAVAQARSPEDRIRALRQTQDFTDSSLDALGAVARHANPGAAADALRAHTAALAAAARSFQDRLSRRPIGADIGADKAAAASLQREVDATWRADNNELQFLLESRVNRLIQAMSIDLIAVALAVALAGIVAAATSAGLADRLSALLKTMDRLIARDVKVEVPFLTDRNETGRIAATLAAFKQSLIHVEEVDRQLRESEERYRILAEQVPDIIARYDLNGIIEYASPSVRQLGYKPEEVVGRHVSEFSRPGDFQGTTLRAASDRQPLPSGSRNETQMPTRDGRLLWIQGHPAAVHDVAGNPIGVVTVLRDVTQRRVMEDELRRKRHEAEAAVVAKSEFLANMSHELRTPLTGIIGFGGLLEKMDGLPDRARFYVGMMLNGGRALLSVVNAVLDFSALEAGGVQLRSQTFSPLVLVEAAVELMRVEAGAKSLALQVEQRGVLPEMTTADADRIRQVLLNLLGNAIKFTNSGGVTVTVSQGDGSRETLRFEVIDTGVGIAADARDRLFHRFSQVDASDSRSYGGVGLGLAISKGLVELMGGQIGLASEEGRGSTFWFTVPVVLCPVGEEPSAEPPAGRDASGARILIVDDVASNRELMTAMLAPLGATIAEAHDGEEAVSASMKSNFDLILMDLQMPRMDGYAATRAIRAKSNRNSATPILAVSADVLPQHVDACLAAGMDDHIAKPIDARDLLIKVSHYMRA